MGGVMMDTDRNMTIRYLIRRLAAHQETVAEMDYPRIEELCFLIRVAMFGDVDDAIGQRHQLTIPKLEARQ